MSMKCCGTARMTSVQADALLHTLGMKEHQRGDTRNRYVTSGAPEPEILELVNMGFMVEAARPGFLAEADRLFMATVAGRIAAEQWQQAQRAEQIASRPKVSARKSASKQRYRKFLRVSDVFNVSFGEYLKRKMYLEH